MCVVWLDLKMDESSVSSRKDEQGKEDSPFRYENGIKSAQRSSLKFTEPSHESSLERVKPQQKFTSEVKQSYSGGRCIQQSFLQRRQASDFKILKKIHSQSLNKKQLQHSLDFVVRASDYSVAPYNFSVNLSSSKLEILFDGSEPIKSRRRNTTAMDDFVIECPSLAGQRNVIISSVGQWIVGAIENNNMRNILEIPLSYNLGALDHDTNIKKAGSIGIKGKKCPSFMSSPSSLSISSSQNLDRETEPQGNHGYRSEAMHKRLISVSSSNSTCSDQSSPSACETISQGMLHCTWKSGVPYFVFSVEDQREVYVANLWVVESSDDKSLDYMYTFHSRTDGPKEQVTCSVSDLVGKMKVSSSFSICSNNSKLIETEFVLFGANENHFGEMQISTPPRKRNSKFPKRVVDVLGTNHPSRDRSSTKFGVPSSILEDFAWEPCQDMFSKLNASSRANLLQSHLLPNLELAAIVVRGYTQDDCEEATVGGWGLKFLKKNGSQQINTSVEASVSSECCPDSFLQKKTNYSSMHVLIPAGIHGGPRTRNGGPSSLSERWRSGGDCDCGGWDIGCPLTVLNSRTSMEEVSQGGAQGECKSLNLFMQGTKQGPTMRMVNIHDDLYFIHFQSTMSALQSFSIGVAIIHSQSPSLCPKNVQKLKQQVSGLTISFS